jgi:exosome complex component RRP4
VNLSGGELRRKSLEDELKMREYLQEGDLISAEVQQTMNDGTVQLHTRSLKYGKVCQRASARAFACAVVSRHMSNRACIAGSAFTLIRATHQLWR